MAAVQIDKKSFFIPEKSSPCELWKTYFQQLRKEVGRENARLIWLITWQANGSASCTANPEFYRWLKQNNIDVSNTATRAVADMSQIGHNVLGLGKRLTGILSVGIPLALAGVLILVIVILINSAKNADLTDVAGLALPKTRLATLAGGIKN